MSETTMNSTWKEAVRHSLPVAMGYVPAAIAFGVLMSAAGLPAWWALFLSIIVYSGAGQYATIPMLASGAGVFAMTLNIGVINLRHVFYALPLMETLPKEKIKRTYCLFALTDESFSVLTTLPAEIAKALFTKIVLLNQTYWVCGTMFGVLMGSGLNDLIPHLDFALTCLFVVLAYEQYVAKKIWWPCVLAVVMFSIAKWLTNDYVLLLSVGFCALAIIVNEWLPKREVQ